MIQKVVGGGASPASPQIPPPENSAPKSASEYHKVIVAYMDQAEPLLKHEWERFNPKTSAIGEEILSGTPEAQAALAMPLVEELRALDRTISLLQSKRQDRRRKVGLYLLISLLGRRLPIQEGVVLSLLNWIGKASYVSHYEYPVTAMVRLAEEWASAGKMTDDLKAGFVRFRNRLARHAGADDRRLCQRLAAAVSEAPELPLVSGEPWADAVIHFLNDCSDETKFFWNELLGLCVTATSANVTQKWLKKAEAILADAQGREEFSRRMSAWLPLVEKPRSAASGYAAVGSYEITDLHQDILRGLTWICGLIATKEMARLMTGLALTCYKKIPGVGSRSVRVGNACVSALGMMGTTDALGQLALIKVRVKFGGAQAAIDKALTQLAERLEVPREEVEEISVPAYGMTGVGELTQRVGDFTAELKVVTSRQTEMLWRRDDGKGQKTLPAAVKSACDEEVKELMAAKKDIEKMLPAQSERLDKLYLQRKSWSVGDWRERYLDHPLVGVLARRLIWNFTSGEITTPGIWLKDTVVNRQGQPLDLNDDGILVTLWHPLNQSVDIVLGWRGFLEEWEIVQPFKQAHREVYLLTPAEEQTQVYSNRFAAHLLRQHQFNALCAARDWKNKIRLMVDDFYPPATRRLSSWGLRAEYWIEGAGSNYGTDTLESGAYRYVATDQVRFYREDAITVNAHASGGGYSSTSFDGTAPEPLRLAEVEPLVFSEIMRDVDLFVGVASVGNDPAWLDGGRDEQQRGYWHDYGFGELSASAQTRRVLLEKLVPRLKIASQCSFVDRFLVVQGKRHRYKIHLGSGNILIAPWDKYLCIVPGQGQVDKAEGKLYLPFEGDRVLSIILSKAFLLAADDKITDPTILSQM
ncbi:DUF4132 domain-containing protein [Prosthecobacter debontii]|nr:DUF4132 domain-containing protein [Prosthecobacter debontii]